MDEANRQTGDHLEESDEREDGPLGSYERISDAPNSNHDPMEAPVVAAGTSGNSPGHIPDFMEL